MRRWLTGLLLAGAVFGTSPAASAQGRSYYQLRIYHCLSGDHSLEQFLETTLVPALHHAGIPRVGVFKPLDVDSTVYVLIPLTSMDAALRQPRDTAPLYSRMESILLYAFEDMPAPAVPDLSAPKSERVYELRSYESATEAYHLSKVRMFNQGGEVALFKKLGFNAVFYADVLSGSRMPNLMYMTTFNSRADRDQHWAAFGSDPTWKNLSALPEYQHNVSKIDDTFLRPLAFSDF
jgi:hypothetical protein